MDDDEPRSRLTDEERLKIGMEAIINGLGPILRHLGAPRAFVVVVLASTLVATTLFRRPPDPE